MERAGKPVVILASHGFEDDIDASAQAFGMPGVQYVVVPSVYNHLTIDEAVAQTDPVVGKILRLLTAAGSASRAGDGEEARSESAELEYNGIDDEEAYASFNRAFLDHDWGDGFPLWPPTRERVLALIAGVDGRADDLVCVLPPGNGYATVHGVAVNAAMAGCIPREMPVVMAALRAISKMKPPWNLAALMSTSATPPMFIVNGPIGRELGINGGRCCLGPGRQNRVNTRIARAIILALKNLGRWYPGIMDMDTIGSARKFGMLIAENEEESPWEPFHVTHDFRPEDSTVTLFFTTSEQDIAFQGHLDAPHLAREIASMMGGGGGLGFTNFIGSEERIHASRQSAKARMTEGGKLLLIAPPHAGPLAEGGFTKEGLQRYLQQHVRSRLSRMRESQRKLYLDGKAKEEYNWVFELSDDEARQITMPAVEDWRSVHVVVAGSVRAKDLDHGVMGTPVIEPITERPTGT